MFRVSSNLQNTLVDDASTSGDLEASLRTKLVPAQDSSFSWSNRDASNIRVLVVLQIESTIQVEQEWAGGEQEYITSIHDEKHLQWSSDDDIFEELTCRIHHSRHQWKEEAEGPCSLID